MSEQARFSLPTALVREAITHVEETYGVFLHEDIVIGLYEELQNRRRLMVQHARETDEDPEGFGASMEFVLSERYTQEDANAQNIYKANKSALGFIASGLKKRRKAPRAPRSRTPTDRLKDHVIRDPAGGRPRFAF